MSELRKDPMTGRFVLFAPEREGRPSDYAPVTGASTGARADCPFCPGNERMTPPERAALGPPGRLPDAPGWLVRVVPNLYAAIDDASGAHDVVVESPDHEADLATLAEPELARVLAAYADRLGALRAEGRHAYALLFRNRGAGAGATRRHPHAQIVATPEVPRALAVEQRTLVAHRDRTGRCLYCDLLAESLAQGDRTVESDGVHAAIAPRASRFPFEVEIAPVAHAGSFAALAADEKPRRSLARVLAGALRRLRAALGEHAYNLAVHDAPFGTPEDDFHWHIEVIPRLVGTGGYEWSGDAHINPVLPETAAARLRSAV